MSNLQPVFLSPALPSELLTYVLENCAYPTTLIVCGRRDDFLAGLLDDLQLRRDGVHDEPQERSESGFWHVSNFPGHQESSSKSHLHAAALQAHAHLVTASLSQLAVSRHIRTFFVPTSTHLRALLPTLVTFPSSKKPTKPLPTLDSVQRSCLLLVYGLVTLHANTSEWSAQGLANTMAALVETARAVDLCAVVVEPKVHSDAIAKKGLNLLDVEMPVLSRLPGMDDEMGAGRAGKRVSLRRVLDKWFRFEERRWK